MTEVREAEPVAQGIGKRNAAVTGRGRIVNALQLLLLFAFLFGYFSFVALHRPADVDEGFHLVCGKSIFEHGRTPYLDFFFFQMPLLPYAYGGAMSIFGYEWQTARIFCALLASFIGAILCHYAFKKTGSRLFCISLALIYCFSPYVFIWFTCGRTHVLSTFFLVGAVVLLRPMNSKATVGRYAVSGFLLGLGIDTRLYFLALAPLLAFHAHVCEKDGHRRAVWWFLAGVSIALMVNIPFFIASPSKYVLNVAGYHALKTPSGLVGGFNQKWNMLVETLFDYPEFRPTLYLGYVVVFLTYLALQAARSVPLSRWNPAFHVSGALFVVSLLPTPSLGQYFSVPVPFFLIVAVDVGQSILEYVKPNVAKRAVIGILMAGSVSFAWLAFDKIDFYILKGNNLEGSMPTEGGKEDWFIENVERVSRAIDTAVASDAKVLSLWPGYLLESGVEIMPRTENVTVLEIEDELPEGISEIAQTITDAEIRQGIRERKLDLVVYGNSIAPHVSVYQELLLASGYKATERIGGISLFLSPDYQSKEPLNKPDQARIAGD